MNLLVKKYLAGEDDIRMFTIPKEEDRISTNSFISIIPVLLLSESERITFNFKSREGTHLRIDAFSDGKIIYEEIAPINNQSLTLFVVKSKLKNFGASYQSIIQLDYYNLLSNFLIFYNDSEQMDLSIIDTEDTIIILQPMPSYDKDIFEYTTSQLRQGKFSEVMNEVRFLNQTTVNLTIDHTE